jgi:RNA polymerase sigma factor for flagellar operon FliA
MRMSRESEAASRDDLVIRHVGLVKSLARRLAQRVPSHVEVSDLVSVGVIGLIDAAGRYRPATGVPFEAFARRRVQGAMLDSLRDLDWAPRSLRRLRRRIEDAVARCRQELGREPEDEEIGAALDLSAEEYARALDQVRGLEVAQVKELDGVGPNGTPLLDVCIDPSEAPDVRLERSELRRHLAAALLALPQRERLILSLHYEEELNLAEIGEVLGVTESRISQLRTLALGRLRASLRAALAPTEAR